MFSILIKYYNNHDQIQNINTLKIISHYFIAISPNTADIKLIITKLKIWFLKLKIKQNSSRKGEIKTIKCS